MLKPILLSLILAASFTAQATPVYTQTPHYDSTHKKLVISSDNNHLLPLPSPYQQQIARILILLQQKQNDVAIQELNQLVSQTQALLAKDSRRAYAAFPDPAFALLVLVDAANQHKQDAYLVAREWVLPLYLRAYAYIDKGDLKAAYTDLNAALQLAPFDPQVLNERGHYHILQKNWAAAEADFKKAQEAAKLLTSTTGGTTLQGRALRGLGYIAVERQQWDAAIAWYQQALALNPQDHVAQSELAHAKRHRPQ